MFAHFCREAGLPRNSFEERRQSLIAATWRILIRDGIAAATTRAICAEAGVKQGMFHYCFSDRGELMREIAAGLMDGQVAASLQVVDTSGSMADAVNRALEVYWDAVESDPGTHQVLYEITTSVLRDERTAEIARFQYRRYLEGVLQSLSQIASIRQIRWDLDSEVLARQVVTVLDGLTLHYLVDRDGPAARAALRSFANDFARHAVAAR